MRLLAVGDIHLGRTPAGLPTALDAHKLGPATAWSRCVDAAVAHETAAVLLAGDVVDRNRDFFLAYGDLKAGIERLAEAGIPVLAVAGNHDTHVLPRLAGEIDSLILLGEGGRWQFHTIDDEVTIAGWSFPAEHVRTSPVEDLEAADTGLPVIGLLHCDRNAGLSPYAPVSSAELAAAPVDGWLLGHIHQPDELSRGTPNGYLGSVSALRASETGARGPWLITVDHRIIRAGHLPLAPLRYDHLEIDAANLAVPDELEGAIAGAAEARAEHLVRADTAPDALGLRVRVTGASDYGPVLAELAKTLSEHNAPWSHAGVHLFVHRVEVEVVPEVDLDTLARHDSPAGLLARRLQILSDPESADARRLVAAARQAMAPELGLAPFRELDPVLSDEEIVAHLRSAGRMALSALMQQKDAGP